MSRTDTYSSRTQADLSRDVVAALEREWETLSSATLSARLRRWSEREPALRQFADARRASRVAAAQARRPSRRGQRS